MLTHSGIKQFACKECEFITSRNSNLKKHFITHCREKPFSCAERSTLKHHIMAHNGERSFKCRVCSSSYSRKSHLTMYMLVHTRERPFSRLSCGDLFARNSHLKRHILFHSEVNACICVICALPLNGKVALKQHTVRVHPESKPFECPECSQRFPVKSSLESHRRTHTGHNIYHSYVSSAALRMRGSHISRGI